jgi:hypothetical protein
MYSSKSVKALAVPFASLLMALVFAGAPERMEAAQKQPANRVGATRVTRATQRTGRVTKKPSRCGSCSSPLKRPPRRTARRTVTPPCHPRGYLDPAVARRFRAAAAEMRRAGITPRVTSAWRSSAHQASLHRCSLSRRCRRTHGIYGAAPSGHSLHEAGFAVDIAGMTSGRRGSRRLSRRGYTIVRIMRKHGFRWPYGMADPVHFEADPRRHGYRTIRHAIIRNQTRCRPAFAFRASVRRGSRRPKTARTASSLAAARLK